MNTYEKAPTGWKGLSINADYCVNYANSMYRISKDAFILASKGSTPISANGTTKYTVLFGIAAV